MDKDAILKRLEDADDHTARQVSRWLSIGDARPITQTPSNVTVYEATHVWRVRQKSSASKGRVLQGAEPLLNRLHGLAPQKKLEHFVFASPTSNGNIFFEKTNRRFVGAILVDKRPSK